jgi:hypothetical protein
VTRDQRRSVAAHRWVAAAGLALELLLTSAVAHGARTSRLKQADVVDAGTAVELDGLWLFRAGDNPAFSQPSLDDVDWEQRQVPTVATPFGARWSGYGWYRLHLRVDERALGGDWALALGPAREVVEVYVNGALLGTRGRFGSRPEGGARLAPLVAFIPAAMVRAGDNLIAVRVYDPTLSGGLAAGPLLLGPPALVADRTEGGRLTIYLRLVLAALSIVMAFSHVVLSRGRWASREGWWLAGAGVGLAVALVGGTGLLEVALPSLELAVRLPMLGASAGAVGLAGFFATRYDDTTSPRVRLGGLVAVTLLAFLLLAPDALAFRVAIPAVLLCSTLAVLYTGWLLAQATRRQEPYTMVVFGSVVVLAAVLVYDGMAASEPLALPTSSMVGALGVLVASALTSVRQTLLEHERALELVQTLEARLDAEQRLGVLEATAMSVQNGARFLDEVVREAARELRVRRCSLVLANTQELVLAASVGLPRETIGMRVQHQGSVAGWVYSNGRVVTDRSMPPELAALSSVGQYATRGFISQPVADEHGRCVAVLNVSDRFDESDFTSGDEEAVAEVARHLGIVLARLGAAA